MDVASRLSALDPERLLFGIGAIITGVLTVAILQTGTSRVHALLFGAFSIYLGGAATPAIRDNVSEYKRTGAIALGGVGVVAMLAGTNSGLPVLFIIGAVAALFNLF